MRTHVLACIAIAALSFPASARAEGTAAPDAKAQKKAPTIVHAPIASAEAGEPLEVHVTIYEAHLVKSATFVYKAREELRALPFRQSPNGLYTAVVPADDMKAPGIGYTIEVEQIDGRRYAIFASREALHEIAVREPSMDAHEKWLLGRLGGRRSVVRATGEFVHFGKTAGAQVACAENPVQGCIPEVNDQYWRTEAAYTYRMLRSVEEFSFRLGVVRGNSLVDATDTKNTDVGLNYGGANVRFRLNDLFRAELSLVGNITEVGFSTGVGAALRIGDSYGTHFAVGFESIGFSSETYFGTRFYTRLEMASFERVTIAPSIEVTDMPHADRFGVRLLTDVTVALNGGFSVGLRAGYQARISRSGGPALGATAALAF